MISEEKVVEFVKKWQKSDYENDRPSFFELTMMMAFEWFAHEKVDFAVIEVGMGGRLDSTNIITPLLSVITNISKDHTQFLGDTLNDIAKEKAGIIKQGIPVVVGEATAETESVFEKHAMENESKIIKAYNFVGEDEVNKLTDFSPLKGDYQKKNLNTAYFVIRELRNLGVLIDDKSIFAGFKNVDSLTGFKGRWTILSENPITIMDTGHNEAGLKYNLSQLQRLKKERKESRIHFVIGFVADKDINNILKLFPEDAIYYLTQAQIPRALPVDDLYNKFIDLNKGDRKDSINKFPKVKEALEAAKKEASQNDIIYIGGSTFIVADALKNQST